MSFFVFSNRPALFPCTLGGREEGRAPLLLLVGLVPCLDLLVAGHGVNALLEAREGVEDRGGDAVEHARGQPGEGAVRLQSEGGRESR